MTKVRDEIIETKIDKDLLIAGVLFALKEVSANGK